MKINLDPYSEYINKGHNEVVERDSIVVADGDLKFEIRIERGMLSVRGLAMMLISPQAANHVCIYEIPIGLISTGKLPPKGDRHESN